MTVIDADAHVNEDVLSWKDLASRHPGWLSAGQSGGKWVAEIEGKLYPTQEGPGCGVPIDSAMATACEAGAADLDQRLLDMDGGGHRRSGAVRWPVDRRVDATPTRASPSTSPRRTTTG